jgi:hypothetical protein
MQDTDPSGHKTSPGIETINRYGPVRAQIHTVSPDYICSYIIRIGNPYILYVYIDSCIFIANHFQSFVDPSLSHTIICLIYILDLRSSPNKRTQTRYNTPLSSDIIKCTKLTQWTLLKWTSKKNVLFKEYFCNDFKAQ